MKKPTNFYAPVAIYDNADTQKKRIISYDYFPVF